MSEPGRLFPLPTLTGSGERAASVEAAQLANENIRLLARLLHDIVQMRAGTLDEILKGHLPLGEADDTTLKGALQLFGIWFSLLATAEEHAAMYRRRQIEIEQGAASVPGTFANVFTSAAEAGIPAADVRDLVRRARVQPVITAHPTEAKRVTIMETHRRIYLLLMDLESSRWTARERNELVRRLRNEIDLLWLTGELRLEKPTVAQEVAWGLHFFRETLFERAPEVIDKLERAFTDAYGGATCEAGPALQFGCWIGGDRDGNPNVTAEVTRSTLFRLRRVILYRYRDQLRELARRLSVAGHAVAVPESFQASLDAALRACRQGRRLRERNPGELFRQYASAMLIRLEKTIEVAEAEEQIPARYSGYQNADQFLQELQDLGEGLRATQCAGLAREYVLPLVRSVEVFGFRCASLDMRENSTMITRTLNAIWAMKTGRPQGECPDYASGEWRAWLDAELAAPQSTLPDFSDLPPPGRGTMALFSMLAATRGALDGRAMGQFVLSMTRSATDVLGVYLLAKYAGLFEDPAGVERCSFTVSPLFETIADLRSAPAIFRELMDCPVVRRTVRSQGGVQEVMIGYSDSNKDGGYFTANWELSLAQKRLTQEAARAKVGISFFHGRGGSVSRGGAPTGHAIAAQPAGSINGMMRLTEQGEVVSSRYANRGTAAYHLELLSASVIEHTLKSSMEDALKPNPQIEEAMAALSDLAYSAYRQLAEHPGLVTYYQAASPVEELGLLNIGSRPARRFGANSLSDLRAIPWVFAWTQNRHLVPGWYGVGTALTEFLKVRGDDGRELLARMFEQSRLFRLIIDEVEKTLAQVDIDIARAYSELVPDRAAGDEIFALIASEYERSVAGVLALSGGEEPADRFPRFRRRLARRLPALNAINEQQVRLLRAFRENPEKDAAEKLEQTVPLLLSINCIATGLGWTG